MKLVAAPPAGLTWPWLVMACGSVALPWALYPMAASGTALRALTLGAMWAALWPVLIGTVLGAALWRWEHRLPRVPEADVIVVGERAMRAAVICAQMIERADDYLRRWPVASLTLLTLVIILSIAMLAWG